MARPTPASRHADDDALLGARSRHAVGASAHRRGRSEARCSSSGAKRSHRLDDQRCPSRRPYVEQTSIALRTRQPTTIARCVTSIAPARVEPTSITRRTSTTVRQQRTPLVVNHALVALTPWAHFAPSSKAMATKRAASTPSPSGWLNPHTRGRAPISPQACSIFTSLVISKRIAEWFRARSGAESRPSLGADCDSVRQDDCLSRRPRLVR